MRKPEGFSLIELLIVVAIILIIAAIAIPNLLRARIAANEGSAVSSMRTIVSAEATYQMAYPTVGFAATMAQLGPGGAGSSCSGPTQATACLVDSLLSNATSASTAKSGYFFGLAGITGGSVVVSYTVGASASGYNSTGVRDFCSVEDGVLRFQNPSGQSAPLDCARNLQLHGSAINPTVRTSRPRVPAKIQSITAALGPFWLEEVVVSPGDHNHVCELVCQVGDDFPKRETDLLRVPK